jgi:hypothetical protein
MPIYDSHSGKNMHRIVHRVLNSLDPNYAKKVVGLSTDGASSMTDSVQGLVSHFRRLSIASFYHIWCISHCIELALGCAIKSYEND